MTAVMETQRLRLIRISQAASVPSREVLRLAGADIATLSGCTDTECLGYVRGSTPIPRTLQLSPIMGQEECHATAEEVQRRVQA